MIKAVPPAFIFLLGALLIPLFKGKLRQLYLLLLPIIGFIDIIQLQQGTSWVYPLLGYDLILCKVDRLSLVVAYIFVIIGFLALLYALHVMEDGQHIAALLYIGSSLGVVFAGDYFTLYAFWEIMAITSVFLVWYQKENSALDAGFRYLIMHIFGGCCLLAGIIISAANTGSIAVTYLGTSLADILILIGFGLNTAFIPIHTWLPDAYPEGTITGSVFMSVYTTKTGVYVLARCFSGMPFVAYMGGIMTVYGVLFALLQNDTRRLLSYHIVSQVGYMVAGVGVGTELGVNGGIAHVFNHILYKALLFMCMGSVIYMTGKRKLTELGGLAKYMPVTCIACIVASLSIAGAPGFNGYVSKGMIITSAAQKHMPILELMMILAAVGTFLSFVKLCYFTFFAPNEEIRAKEAPLNMQLAMLLTAFLCVFIGVYPKVLFHVLPYNPVHYNPYVLSHVIGTIQLFILAGLVFMLALTAFSPHRWIVLDFDYFYRIGARGIMQLCHASNKLRLRLQATATRLVNTSIEVSKNPIASSEVLFFRRGDMKRIPPYDESVHRQPVGIGVLFAVLLVILYALVFYFKG